MKKQLFAYIFAITLSAVLSAYQANAQGPQAVRVDVPFAFTASNRTLSAGTYMIEPVGSSLAFWRIRGTHHEPGEFLLALTREGSPDGNLRLTFHRYGETRFLAGFRTPSYEVALPVSNGEKSLRLARVPLAGTEVIKVETTKGGSR
jgi:hypothetical protein